MVIQKEQPIAMPKPAWAKQPVIGSRPRDDGKPGVQYSVQITGAIQSIYQFTELCELLLNKCTKDDLVDIMIDTPGGCVFSTLLLLSWMRSPLWPLAWWLLPELFCGSMQKIGNSRTGHTSCSTIRHMETVARLSIFKKPQQTW